MGDGGFFRTRRGSALLCMSAIIAASFLYHGGTNLDVFFMARQGGDLLAGNWDRSVDFISLHEWLPFTHQKWAMCLLSYFVMGRFGLAGSHFGAIALFALTGIAAMFVFDSLWPRADGRHRLLPALLLMGALGSELLTSFRPHCVAGLFLLLELWALERHACGRLRPAGLCAVLFACSAGTMWFHSTMWPMCLVPLLPYLCETGLLARLSKGRLRAEPCRKLPLLAGAACMFLAACLNPAGPGEFRYIALCLTAMDPGRLWHVVELQPFFPYAGSFPMAWSCVWIGWMVLSGAAVFRKGRHEREVFFWLGSLLMMLHAVRLMYQAFIFTWFVSARYLCTDRLPGDAGGRRLARFETGSLFVAAVAAIVAQTLAGQPFAGPGMYTQWEMDRYLMRESELAYRAISEDGGDGADVFGELIESDVYLSEHGLRPFMDCRAELYVAEDANGLSPLDALYSIGQDGEWDGRPLDRDGALSFLRYYGIRYVVGAEGGFAMDPDGSAFMGFVRDACSLVWRDGSFSVYRVPYGPDDV